MINLLEGKISQFVRSEFKQRPTKYWQEQWPLVAEQLFNQA
jgi:TetR/AcrR family transcriptional regulator